MTASVSVYVGRRVPPGREELRRQLLALVLAFVLVWYTFVVPANASALSPRRILPDDEGHDGEVRGVTPQSVKTNPQSIEDLDWPEYIYP
jgi:hypothetical protein